MQQPKSDLPLIGAHGLFWERDEVSFSASTGTTWQMLGRRGASRSTLEICDFRRARGVYVLFNNHGPTYVGRARGKEGFGDRLRSHDRDPFKDWRRFCWFSFDPVVDWPDHTNWRQRDAVDRSTEVGGGSAIDELEALMITAFGLSGQNQMRLRCGKPWHQVTYQDCGPSGLIRRADTRPIRDSDLRESLAL